jgi:hypothetical protein
VLLLAGPAAADTSQARATAARVTLLNASVLDTGQVAASNDGSGEVKTGATSTTILAGQTLLTAGVFAQDATAGSDGTSAACAGAVGAGGLVQIGPSGGCTATIGTPDGVTVNLNPGLATIGADAIYAECTATTAGETGRATLVDANIFLLGTPLPIALATAPAPNQGLTVPNIASVVLNEQINNPDGSLTVNALHITLLGGNLADIIVGSVTCGPNAVTPPVSIFAGPALPAAAAAAMAVGATVFVRRRRMAADQTA